MEACAISTCNLIRVWMLAFVSASVFGLQEVAAKALAAGKKGMMGLPGEGGESWDSWDEDWVTTGRGDQI